MSQEPIEGAPQSGADDGAKALEAETLAQRLAENSGLKRNDEGNIDVLASIGGVRGLIESVAPGLVFLGFFIATQQLNIALIAALAVGVVLLVLRLIGRTPVMPAITGLVGIGICAPFARVGGEARDYYVPGFYISGIYGAAFAVSALVRWPIIGLIFGYLRGEGLAWRKDRVRMSRYTIGTWIVVAAFALRLLVQIPLYFANEVALLGAARAAMGLPLYVGAVALAWLISRPAKGAQEPAKNDSPADGPAAQA